MSISRVISLIVIFFRRHAFWRFAACVVLASTLAQPHIATATTVRMEMTTGAGTALGTVDVELYDDEAPITVRNFLKYAGIGYYDNIIIHRSIPRFVIQGGGYMNGMTSSGPAYVEPPLGKFQPIKNEFSLLRSNVRRTIAMAKLPGNVNSATSEWFFNLADNNDPTNPLSLDNQNGGFTVFGRVLDTGPGTGMDVVDAIAGLKVCKVAVNIFNVVTDPACSVYNSAFTDLPVYNFDSAAGLQPSNLVLVHRIPNVKSTRTDLGTIPTYAADVDMEFNLVRTETTAVVKELLKSFSSPPNQSVHFNNGIHTLWVSGNMDPAGEVVTMYDGATTRPTHYYAYGATPDNPEPHWYDFSYDSETGTGAKIEGDKIILHFVDNQRGDYNQTVNSITHTGAQAVVTATSTDSGATQPGGCSITTTPSGMSRGGDWILVSMFLVFVELARRRARHNQVQRCSPDAGA